MLTIAVLTISDASSRGQRHDKSGEVIVRLVERAGHRVAERGLVPDERDQIAARLRGWVEKGVDAVLTTGGTGLGPRDVTPEATRDVIDRELPGLAEWMRVESVKVNVHAVLSRAVAGAKGRTLIVNLPGSPKGVEEMLALILPVLPHASEILKGGGADHTPPTASGDKHERRHGDLGHHKH
ncbi:MAG: MogA/MoaB family molybdenum cofactor biosynthesis protein [Chloroflexi bacterium]|nr:MogA/MoaB family molybdenum cofactor biosynthesis protein [Chloroflexota bacterium]